MNRLFFISFVFFYNLCFAQNTDSIEPGKPWLDTDGKLIEAHGGGILKVKDIYYWYGENKSAGANNKVGVGCYSSKDLFTWKNEGIALPKEALPIEFQDKGVCERPKVIYNAKTKKFVMWMHLDDEHYTASVAGVALADKPTGPFNLVSYKRPIHYDYGYVGGSARTWKKMDPQEKELGNTFRDMNLFLDDDGKAYVFYASEDNQTLYISRLNNTFTDVEKPTVEGQTWVRVFVNGNREAPAPFKYKSKYYLITSGLTGWSPNAAQYAMADNILGPWLVKGNPCRGENAETTFNSQGTFVIAAPGKPEGNFIFMADRWNAKSLVDSRFVWLPFTIKDETIEIEYKNRWDFGVFDSLKP